MGRHHKKRLKSHTNTGSAKDSQRKNRRRSIKHSNVKSRNRNKQFKSKKRMVIQTGKNKT